MIKEIDEDIYERNNVLPIKTRKEIEERRNKKRDILSKSESWEIYQYFEENEGDTRRLIKKGKDACMVTTTKEGILPHIDIIQYEKDEKVKTLTSIDICQDGFDYTVKGEEFCKTMQIYRKRENRGIELNFYIMPLSLNAPIIEVAESPKHHTISYILEYEIGQKPIKVTLFTGKTPVRYMREKDEEDYHLIDSGIFKSLKDMFSRKKTKTLQEVEEEFGAKYAYEDDLSDKFQEAYQIQFKGIKLPEELQTLLDRLPTSDRTISHLEETHSHERIQENGNRQKGSDYTK